MSWLSKWGKKAEKWVSNAVPHTHSAERRKAMQEAEEQISYYQGLKEEAAKQKKENEEQKRIEQRKIAEKQARSFKRRKRASGFLSDDSTGQVSDVLG
jgi:hypothetical protein